MRKAMKRAGAGLAMLTGTGAGASVVLAFLVIATVLVAVAMPRASLSYRTAALTRIIHAIPSSGQTVVVTANFPQYAVTASAGGVSRLMAPAGIGQVSEEIGSNLVHDRLPLQGAQDRWWGLATNYLSALRAPRAAYNGSTPPQVEVLDRPLLSSRSRLVDGHLPTKSSVSRSSARFQVAVTTATAAKWHIRPGAVFKVNSAGVAVTLTVTGIVRPRDTGSSFWTQDPNASAVTFNSTQFGGYWLGAVFVAPSALIHLEAAYANGTMLVTWEYPLALGSANANQASLLSNDLGQALQTAGILNGGRGLQPNLAVSSGLNSPLAQFVQQQDQVGSLLALLYVSLTVVSAAVLLLGDLLLAERRAAEFGLIRARGAGRRQLALLALRGGAVVVLPAAVIGALIGVALTPGGGEPLAWWLAGATALVALAGVPLLAVRRASATVAARRDADVPPTRAERARRLVLDVTLVAAAIGGIVVLRSQGAGSGDWYTSAAPALVAVPAAVVMVRLYPVVVRWLVRLTGRRHGVSAYVGLARAVRSSVSTVLPVFALVLALGVIAFGATLRAAVVRDDQAASWSATGADVVVNAGGSSLPLNAAAQRAINAVPGVSRSAAITEEAGSAADGTTLNVVALDPASYAALVAATPLRPADIRPLTGSGGASSPGGSGSVPVLASPGAAASLRHGSQVLIEAATVRMRVIGRITSLPGVPNSGPMVVVPDRTLAAAIGTNLSPPNLMLIVGSGIDDAKLKSVVGRMLPGATLTFRSSSLAALTGAPLQRGAYASFAEGAAVAAGLGAVILAIMLALGARPRELTLARLLTMGLSPGQARRLVVAEVLPTIVAATIGGLCCAWALVKLLGSAISLSPLTGTSTAVPVRADYAVLGYLAASLLVLAVVTLLAQSAAARFRGLARALRVGE